MKYKLTGNTIEHNDKKLCQIIALKDFSNVKKDDLGGYIEKEANLSQENNCWVYSNAKVFGDASVSDNACVYGNAKVYGNTRVFGNAKVSGNTICAKSPVNLILPKHSITISDNYIAIGCENHSIDYWKENLHEIGEKNGYTEDERSEILMILSATVRSIPSRQIIKRKEMLNLIANQLDFLSGKFTGARSDFSEKELASADVILTTLQAAGMKISTFGDLPHLVVTNSNVKEWWSMISKEILKRVNNIKKKIGIISIS